MPAIPSYTFADFIKKFPLVPMPVTLGEETHLIFSKENEPLPLEMVDKYITQSEAEPDDEFTEYVPCLAIDEAEKYVGLIWWRAGLMNYEYVLATYTPKGELIQKKVIARTRVEGEKIHRSVANIDEDLIIWIAEGIEETNAPGAGFSPESTKVSSLEIMANGMIVGS
jgi:hypothetical protein